MRTTVEWQFPNGGTIQLTTVTDLDGHSYISAVKADWINAKLHEIALAIEEEAKRTISNGHFI